MELPQRPVHPSIQNAFDAYLAAAKLERQAGGAGDEAARQILLVQAEAARMVGEAALRHIGSDAV